MSDDQSKVADKASEIAKNIWLAGLGAYGKAFDEARDRLDEASKEPPRLFKELVKKGEHLEDEVRDSLSTIRKSRAHSVEERIQRVRDNFAMSLPAKAEQLAEISNKLDVLTAKVDALSKALEKKPARKAKAKTPAKSKVKAPARKKPATRKKS